MKLIRILLKWKHKCKKKNAILTVMFAQAKLLYCLKTFALVIRAVTSYMNYKGKRGEVRSWKLNQPG